MGPSGLCSQVGGTQIHHSKNAARWLLQPPLSMLIFNPAVTVNALPFTSTLENTCAYVGVKKISSEKQSTSYLISGKHPGIDTIFISSSSKSCPLSKGPGETVQQPDLEHHKGQSHTIRVDRASSVCLACRKGKLYN